MCSKFCCSCPLQPEMIKMGLGSHQMYNNNIIKFQEPTIILNASTKKVWKLIEAPGIPQILKTEIQA